MQRPRRIATALAALTLLLLLGDWLRPAPAARPSPAASALEPLRALPRGWLAALGAAPARGASLSGRVYAASGAFAGARVCAACAGCEGTSAPPSPCTRSGADGAYVFEALAAGAYFVHASAARGATASTRAGA